MLTSYVIQKNETLLVANVSDTVADTKSISITLEAPSMLLGLNVESISGTLDVTVYGEDAVLNNNKKLLEFDQISSPTSSVILRRCNNPLDKILVECTYTDAVQFTLHAKGSEDISSMLGGKSASIKVTRTPKLAAVGTETLPDRKHLIISNESPDDVYWGNTSAVTWRTGTIIYSGCGTVLKDVGDVWLVSRSGRRTVKITEGY